MRQVTLLIVGVIASTSVSALLFGTKYLRLSITNLSTATRNMLDCTGTILLFVLLNLTVGASVILGARLVAGRFLSLYLLDDPAWLVLSTLQGLTWSLWRQRA